MAVKVISDKPTKTYQIVCPHCDYLLEYLKEDIDTTYDSDGDAYRDIICARPTCGKQITVPKP